jgi:hypothetical protein
MVEPCYTLRPIQNELRAQGLEVVAWQTTETLGLGEAGSTIKPEMRWVLRREGNIIMDIGYGVEGAKTLNLVEGARESSQLQIYAVLNIGRPMTASVDDIVEYLHFIRPIHGLINNTHLGDDTTVDFIQEGAKLLSEVSIITGIPIIATTADIKFKEVLGEKDCVNNPVRYLKRFMPKAFW